jgi:hypothetical protein
MIEPDVRRSIEGEAGMEQGEREVLMRQLEERRDIIDVYKRILGEVQAERDRYREALVAMATNLTKALGPLEPKHGRVER